MQYGGDATHNLVLACINLKCDIMLWCLKLTKYYRLEFVISRKKIQIQQIADEFWRVRVVLYDRSGKNEKKYVENMDRKFPLLCMHFDNEEIVAHNTITCFAIVEPNRCLPIPTTKRCMSMRIIFVLFYSFKKLFFSCSLVSFRFFL